KGGLSSGEGLIYHVRDASTKLDPKKGVTVVVDEGVPDKRMFGYEPEFAQVLVQFKREQNTLSALLRQCWEGRETLSNLTKNNSMTATNAHVTLVAHVTPEELKEMLSTTQQKNGMANRFAWFLVRRSKVLPFGGDEPDLTSIVAKFKSAVTFA